MQGGLKLAVQAIYQELKEALEEIGEFKLKEGEPYYVEVSLKEKSVKVGLEVGGIRGREKVEFEGRKARFNGFRSYLEAYGFASLVWKELIKADGEIWRLESGLEEVKKKTGGL